MKIKENRSTFIQTLARQLKIWVLVPHVESEDPNIQYYYDFTQSHEEYRKVFDELKVEWMWQPVTLENYKKVIDQIALSMNGKSPLVFNLCDGDEVNGAPGISVVHYLAEKGISYTGAASTFYEITTSKVTMKKAFQKCGVSTPEFEVISNKEQSINGIFDRLGKTLILKPAISGGSMGVSVKNVVHSEKELKDQIHFLFDGYHGWNLTTGGLIIEPYINGPEYTTLIVGTAKRADECIHYLPVERVFHASLPDNEKFLSFDRLWEFYEKEPAMPGAENFFEYFLPQDGLIQDLQKITLEAYKAVHGNGYARFDIRMDAVTKKMYVLEANAQCGLSEDENNTSIGAILRVTGKSFTDLLLEIIQDALRKSKHSDN